MSDPLYVRARAALLEAAEALEEHLDAVVLVGAQAIYLHTGGADLAVAEYTTDADFTVSPADLADAPLLSDLLTGHGFTQREHPGGWLSPDGIYVDIMVPEALAGPGTRGARLGAHGKRAARRARGLEGALVDREKGTIASLDPGDDRQIDMWVAGPGALLVAKVHKIAERVDADDRVRDKDALDVLRLLRAVDTKDLARRLLALRSNPLAGAVTVDAINRLPPLFGATTRDGVAMAVRAAGTADDPATIAASLVALAEDLLSAIEAGR
ncbi:MAG: hypothetical protein ACRDX9_15745 [Acidimicrobiia bacterium]